MIFRMLRAGPLTMLLLLAVHVSGSGGSRYFPETGKGAIRQRALDIAGGAVAMSIALQPGHEDHALLARLRMALGARTVVVFVTNGGATPSDLNGEAPQYTASGRKEEALAAISSLGGQPYFLNLPDPGFVSDPSVLARIWDPDTAATRLGRAIQAYRPDVVILQGDLRGDTLVSVRYRLLLDLVMKGASPDSAAVKEGRGRAWRVPRILVEETNSPKRVNGEFDEVHPVWKVSYRTIGTEAAAQYASLRFERKRWASRGDRTYRQIIPFSAPARGSAVAGYPILGRRVKGLAKVVRAAASAPGGHGLEPSLEKVSAAIDSVERVIAYQGDDLSPGELRVVAGWKNGLEDLRCTLLGVSVAFASSDSLVTQAQLFTLKIDGVNSKTSGKGLKILFPGALEKKWGINESAQYKFDLSPPQEFRVITPKSLEFNTPGAQFGINRPVLRTRFPFLIYHEDSIRSRNFVYRGEVFLRAAPRRTFELLSPAIRAQEGEPVIYRLMNVSRDAYRGTIGFADSLVDPAMKQVLFSQRGQIILDTLLFHPLREPLPATFSVNVRLSGEGVSNTVRARRFEVLRDTAAIVGLITAIEESPVAQSLRRLRIPFLQMGATGDPGTQLEGRNSMILDRDALAGMSDPAGWSAALTVWVGKGGHLVVLPQMAWGKDLPFLAGVRYLPSPWLEAGEEIRGSTDNSFLRKPNLLSEPDWQDWVVSRSAGAIDLTACPDAEQILRDARTNATLLASTPVGRGRVTIVALDLVSQLLNVHPGAHRLLANLVRPAPLP